MKRNMGVAGVLAVWACGVGSGCGRLTHGPVSSGVADASATLTKHGEPARPGPDDYRPELAEDQVATVMAFPTGVASSSAILLYQVMPAEVRRGENFGYAYHVVNLSGSTLRNVVVRQSRASNLRVRSSNPAVGRSDEGTVWTVGELGPGEVRVIEVVAAADALGVASECVSVSYNVVLCAAAQVVEPALTLTKIAPDVVLRCQPVCMRYVVTNTGTGTAAGVVITDTLSEGLSLANGSRLVTIEVGALGAGESKTIEVCAEATGTGLFCSGASVTSGDLTASAEQTETAVRAPRLEITSSCGGVSKSEADGFIHTYTVTNTGDGVANDAVASIAVADRAMVVRASEGGVLRGREAVWTFGTIGPGQSREFAVTLVGGRAGAYETNATVNASCADTAADRCVTEFGGAP